MKLERARKHIEMHHQNADGWITLAKKEEGKFVQYHYKPEEIVSKLSEWVGEDVYFSQNTFYKPQRRIDSIRQLRASYADVDFYLLNLDPIWVIGKMEQELFNNKIPEPNFIIHSGRGFCLIWLIEPVPYKALPLWNAVEKYLIDQLKGLGADSKASDPARVLRLSGSINSKNGEEVTIQYRHEHRYDLRQIQTDYLPTILPRRSKKIAIFSSSTYSRNSLYAERIKDLVRLVELRNGKVKGYREIICFLYRYWTCCFLSDEREALRQMLELNSEFAEPLPEREVVRATRSAETAWQAKNNKEANRIAKEKGYPGAGYNISNQKLIEWLQITEDEQKHLHTIVGRKVKYQRNNVKRQKARREVGKLSRHEYLLGQTRLTESKLETLRTLLKVNPKSSRKELAAILGVSVYRIDQLKKSL